MKGIGLQASGLTVEHLKTNLSICKRPGEIQRILEYRSNKRRLTQRVYQRHRLGNKSWSDKEL